MDIERSTPLRAFRDDFRWDDVEFLPYKQEASAPFKAISRQVLFHEPELACELRYSRWSPAAFPRSSGMNTCMAS